MAKLGISTGFVPNDGSGDSLLDGASKINLNFDEIYNALGDGTTISGTAVTAIVAGDNIVVQRNAGSVTVTGTATTDFINANTLNVTGISTLGVVTGATYYGDGSNLTGVFAEISNDTMPTLGGNLDLAGYTITGSGGIHITGVVTATEFVGDGSKLSGVAKTEYWTGNGDDIYRNSNVGINSEEPGVALDVVGDANITGVLTATTARFINVSIAQTLTYEDVTNVDSIGLITARSGIDIGSSKEIILSSNGDAEYSGIVTAVQFVGTDIDIAGVVTATNVSVGQSVTAVNFYGDGSGLTNVSTGSLNNIVEDTDPQLGGNLDLNGNTIDGSGGINVTGVVTATSFDGLGSNITGISTLNITNYGVGFDNINDIVEDTTPQLGGDLDLNGKTIEGSGGINVTGVVTATNVSVGQSVTATNFYGDGSGLTNVSTGSLNNIVEDTDPQLGGNLDLNGKTIEGSGGINVTGVVTATSFDGLGSNITGISTLNITNYGTGLITDLVGDTTPQLGGNLDLNGKTIEGSGGINITGVVTATEFIGDGSGLTGLITDLIGDETPQLGGDLDLNGKTIEGSGGINVTGVVTATSFDGLGSNITGISTLNITNYAVDLNNLDNIVEDTTPQLGGDLDLNGKTINGSGGINITGVITATEAKFDNVSIAGTLTYEDVTNVDSIGLITARSGIDIGSPGAGTTLFSDGSAIFTGIVTATNVSVGQSVNATNFYGDGSGLTNVPLELIQDSTPDLGGDLNINGNTIKGTGGITIAGFITATFGGFVGDGSGLTNVPGTGGLNAVENDTNPALGGDLSLNGYTIEGTGGVNIVGTITASSYKGNGSSLVGVIGAVGEDTNPVLGGNLNLNTNDIFGTGDIDITGFVTATSFDGDGASITGISTLNIVDYGEGFGGLDALVDDTNPTLGANLNLANNNIINSGGSGSKIDISTGTINAGVISATSLGFYGSGANITGLKTENIEGTIGRLNDLIDDTNPSLGGDLLLNGRHIRNNAGASNISISGIMTAVQFDGGGANITGISTLNIVNYQGGLNKVEDDGTPKLGGNLNLNNNLIFGTGGALISGFVTATSFTGSGSGLTNVLKNVSDDTTPQLGGPLDLNGKSISGGNGSVDCNVDLVGIVTATRFTGIGSNITGISTLNIVAYGEGFGGLDALIDDTTPFLGGDLGLNGFNIVNNTGLSNIRIAGVMTATKFVGSGASITNVLHDVSEDTNPQLGGNLDINGNNITGNGNLSINGDVFIGGSGIVTASLFDGNINSSGVVTASRFDGNLNGSLAGNLDLNSNDITGTGDINIIGSIVGSSIAGGKVSTAGSATAANFYGDGTNITGIKTENISDYLTAGIHTENIIDYGVGLRNLDAVVEDTNPQLGGDLDLGPYDIITTSGAAAKITLPGSDITAFRFIGSGSSITGISTLNIVDYGVGFGGLNDVIDDETPELGGDLLLNGKHIRNNTGASNISISGIMTAAQFSGSGGNITGILTSNIIGYAGGLSVVQDDATPTLGGTLDLNGYGINGTGVITATSFSGSGLQLTNVLKNVSDDATPQLGGPLDLNGKSVSGGTGSVDCNVNLVGIVTATRFSGIGSNVTGILTSNIIGYGDGFGAGSLNQVSDDTNPELGGDLNLNSKTIEGTGGINIVGTITATNYNGNGSTLTGVIGAVGEDTNPLLGGNLGLNNKKITGTGDINIIGFVTASSFSGTGANITGISTSNIVDYGVGFGGLDALVDDPDPTLGADLDLSTFNIVTSSGSAAEIDLPSSKITANLFVGSGSSITGIKTENIVNYGVGFGGLNFVQDDTSPTLGGNLSLNGFHIQNTTGASNISITGIMTATQFSGGGANITGIQTTNIVDYAGGLGVVQDDSTPTLGGNLDLNGFNITGGTGPNPSNINIVGNCTATNFFGNGGTLSNVLGNLVEDDTPQLGGPLDLNNFSVSGGTVNVDCNFDLIGIVTATKFVGDGSDITGISTSNIVGYEVGLGIDELSQDSTPQLGGTLDLNGYGINGTGVVTATSFSGDGANITGISTLNITGYSVGSGIAELSQDTTPQLGGNLDTNNNDIQFGDSDEAKFSGTRLRIRHEGLLGSAIISNTTGSLIVRHSTNGSIIMESGSSVKAAEFKNSGSSLYHKGFEKLSVNSSGIIVTGILTADNFYGNGANITGISTLNITGYGVGLNNLNNVVEDTNPQLGGNLDLNTNDITGTGDIDITGSISATSFSGDGANITGISTLNIDGYSVGSGISSVFLDPAPQLGGNLDLNDNIIFGTGGINVSGIITATEINATGFSTFSKLVDAELGLQANNITLGVGGNTINTLSGNLAITANNGNSSNTIFLNAGTTSLSNDVNLGTNGTDKTISFLGRVDTSIDPSTNNTNDLGSSDLTWKDLYIGGNASIGSSVTAAEFYGGGANITGISTLNITNYLVGISTLNIDNYLIGIATENIIDYGDGFLSNLTDDTTPQLGGNLDLNSKTIDGTGGISITGVVTATSFSGFGTNVTGILTSNIIGYGDGFGGSGITDLVQDTDPQLGGNLDLNGKTIDGSGGISITGVITATSFVGGGGSITGISTLNITDYGVGLNNLDNVVEDETPQLGGDLDLNGKTINGSGGINITGVITATSFSGAFNGDGSGLTGISADPPAGINTSGTSEFNNIDAVGVITASQFVGGGASITGISTLNITDYGVGLNNLNNVVEDTNPQLGGNLDLNGNTIDGTGGINITGVVTATSFSGFGTNITGISTLNITDYGVGLNNLDSVVEDTNPQLGGNLDLNGNTIDGTGGINITGVVTATNVSVGQSVTAANFYGDGSNLTGVVADSGTASYAEIAGIATVAENLTGTPTIQVTNITAVDGTFTGNVSIAGTLTYEDVTNVDSVGLITARSGINVGTPGAGTTLFSDGSAIFTGIVTATSFVGGGANITGISTLNITDYGVGLNNLNNVVEDTNPQLGGNLDLNGNTIDGTGGINITGVVTATNVSVGQSVTAANFYGDGSGLVNVPGTGGLSNVVEDETPQLGGPLDLNGNDISGTGNLNVIGIVTTTTFNTNNSSLVSTSGTFTASPGVAYTMDSYTLATDNLKTAEYTIFIENGNNIQSQKLLVMQNGTTAFSQEYAIMFNPNEIATITSTLSSGTVNVELTPETGISGLTTFSYIRQSIL